MSDFSKQIAKMIDDNFENGCKTVSDKFNIPLKDVYDCFKIETKKKMTKKRTEDESSEKPKKKKPKTNVNVPDPLPEIDDDIPMPEIDDLEDVQIEVEENKDQPPIQKMGENSNYNLESISKMKLKELKDVLVSEGLSKLGKINVLRERLSDHYIKKYANETTETTEETKENENLDDDVPDIDEQDDILQADEIQQYDGKEIAIKFDTCEVYSKDEDGDWVLSGTWDAETEQPIFQ